MSSLNNDVLPSNGDEEKIPGQDPLLESDNNNESVQAMSDMAMRRSLLGKLIIPPSLP